MITATGQEEATDAHARAQTRAGSTAAHLLDIGSVGLACVLFLALTLYRLDLPGLYPDEAFDVIPAVQLLLGHPVELQRGVGLHLFGLDLPLMSSSDYQGVTSTYLALPFFAIFGINVFALRLMTVTVGLVGVVLTYFLARSWYGRGVARLAVLLIATSPAWVFWSRLGVYVVSQVMPIAAGALLAFTTWARRRPLGASNRPLYLGMFMLGLGLTTKLLFLWFIAAVPLAALVLFGPRMWRARREWLRPRWARIALLSSATFCAGAAPFILYNLMSRGTFNLIRHTLSLPGTTHGVDNSAVLRNLWTRADNFRVLLDGSFFWFQSALDPLTGQPVVYYNPLTPAIFALSATGLVALALLGRGRGTSEPESSSGALLAGAGFFAVSASIALILSTGIFSGTPAALGVLLAGVSSLGGAVFTVRAALRHPSLLPRAAWGLLGLTLLAGALWWFTGAGRLEGKAPGALLGLWPTDGAGALFWVAGASLLLLLGWDRSPAPGQRTVVACLALIGLVLGESAVTVSGLWSTHLIVLLPLPQIAIAAFALSLARRVSALVASSSGKGPRAVMIRRAAWLLPVLALVGSIVVQDVRVAFQYHRDMAITGGSSTFSDAIYALSAYLDTRNPRPAVISLDWGIKRPIQFLTEDRVNPEDAYGYEVEPSEATRQALRALVQQDGALYLFHTEQAGISYPRMDLFRQLAAEAGKTPRLVRTFHSRDGFPLFEVYTLDP